MNISQLFNIENIITFIIGSYVGNLIYKIIITKKISTDKSIPLSLKNINYCQLINIFPFSIIFFNNSLKKNGTYKFSMGLLYQINFGLVFLINNYSSYLNKDNSLIHFLSFAFIIIISIITILDIIYFWIPKSLCILGIILGILHSLMIDITNNNFLSFPLTFGSIFSAFIGFLIFILISFLGFHVLKRPVIGGSDSYYAALIGTWLRMKGLYISLYLAFLIAGIYVIVGFLFGKHERYKKIPLGPFLSLSTFIVWLFGNNILENIIFNHYKW